MTHHCDVGDLDYTYVERGQITCTACERTWTLQRWVDATQRTRLQWVADPCGGCGASPCRCRHGQRGNTTPARRTTPDRAAAQAAALRARSRDYERGWDRGW